MAMDQNWFETNAPSANTPLTPDQQAAEDAYLKTLTGGSGQQLVDFLHNNDPSAVARLFAPETGGTSVFTNTPGTGGPGATDTLSGASGTTTSPSFPAPSLSDPSQYPAPGVPSLIPAPDPLQPWTQQFNAPNPSDVLSDPVFQASLNQGIQAIQRSAAAKGTLLTGGTIKGMQDYGTTEANKFYGDQYNRAYNNYDTARQNFLTNEANRYNSQRQNNIDTFAQEGGIFDMNNLNRMNSWQIASDYFNQGRANRLDSFNMYNTTDMNNFLKNYDIAQLGRVPYPNIA